MMDFPLPCLITGGYILVHLGECKATLDTGLKRRILGFVKMWQIIGTPQEREWSYTYKKRTKVLVFGMRGLKT